MIRYFCLLIMVMLLSLGMAQAQSGRGSPFTAYLGDDTWIGYTGTWEPDQSHISKLSGDAGWVGTGAICLAPFSGITGADFQHLSTCGNNYFWEQGWTEMNEYWDSPGFNYLIDGSTTDWNLLFGYMQFDTFVKWQCDNPAGPGQPIVLIPPTFYGC